MLTKTLETIPSALPLIKIPDGHGRNLYDTDRDLPGLLRLYLSAAEAEHFLPHLRRLGKVAGERLDDLAMLADKYTPQLSTRTRAGEEQDEIYKHPAYVELERWAFSEFGLAAASHVPGVLGWHEPLPPVVKYTLFYLFSQTEFGLTCPVNMTDSLSRTLKKYGSQALIDAYLPKLTSLDFDDLFQGAMFMTEQGAGSDIARTETQALRHGDSWLLYGDKWFCSNADAEVAMVLARHEGAPEGMAGVSLFLLPRTLSDGSRNHYRILRLKDKLGTRSMPSGEIRFDGAEAYLVGELGRGFQQMAEMVNSSRLSNGVRSGALMRRSLTEALYVAHNRRAFGKLLHELPLMRRQLDKMELLTEQARSFGYQVARQLQLADQQDERAAALVRLLTPIIKFRSCRDARKVAGDAMEVRGGCGYIEEWVEARLVRDSHLGSIWEGTSNIVALDVYRACRKVAALDAYESHFGELLDAAGDGASQRLRPLLATTIRLAQDNIDRDAQENAREVCSLLYHMATAIIFAWEASHETLAHRAKLLDAVVTHRLDPLVSRLARG
ncbi:acyl-CoA dehydrogenase family protein [Parapusillimonas sp. JC17]|uniref:acyl-CoA dehydrogenase family protein n=1 Tax=Parapusillimonas sp. JC17 TaxID=3445768 RepID=UPI003F9F2518